MKAQIILLLTLFLCVSCNNKKENHLEEKENVHTEDKITKSYPLEGAWELVSFYNYVDDKVKDSSFTDPNQRQIKLYTKEKFMWSKKRPADSTEWFAYGNYKVENNMLIEHVEYGSLTMDNIMKQRSSFDYELIIFEKSFSQVELDENGSRIYSENYKRLE
ncbi:hypothetical protein [Olleya aquimaris]|uniref:Lipocalin-like domain-containing protein n=1 Tax=Olleya aquimaris TaxID=639310 RepID=A0A327RSW2_9FLAO|nr:hypothetical protein [Olleya aquimaris]RAJ16807.1 hypothetical protein LY08_00583 [Olleya aquimaris]